MAESWRRNRCAPRRQRATIATSGAHPRSNPGRRGHTHRPPGQARRSGDRGRSRGPRAGARRGHEGSPPARRPCDARDEASRGRWRDHTPPTSVPAPQGSLCWLPGGRLILEPLAAWLSTKRWHFGRSCSYAVDIESSLSRLGGLRRAAGRTHRIENPPTGSEVRFAPRSQLRPSYRAVALVLAIWAIVFALAVIVISATAAGPKQAANRAPIPAAVVQPSLTVTVLAPAPMPPSQLAAAPRVRTASHASARPRTAATSRPLHSTPVLTLPSVGGATSTGAGGGGSGGGAPAQVHSSAPRASAPPAPVTQPVPVRQVSPPPARAPVRSSGSGTSSGSAGSGSASTRTGTVSGSSGGGSGSGTVGGGG